MTDNTLIPIEQKTVAFYDDELVAIRADDDQIYVSLRHMCEALGIVTQGQTRRIQRHTVLSDGLQGVDMMSTPSADGRGGGRQRFNMLRVDLIPLWLSGIDTKRVNLEVRDKLERYQREAARVLWQAFKTGELTGDVIFDELLKADSPEVQIYKMLTGMAQMARNQIILQSQVKDHEVRLQDIEHTLGKGEHFITRSQAMEISQAVKAIALELSARSKKNEFGGVYGELYRKYEINSYKELPVSHFREAMDFLNEWLQVLINNDVEF